MCQFIKLFLFAENGIFRMLAILQKTKKASELDKGKQNTENTLEKMFKWHS